MNRLNAIGLALAVLLLGATGLEAHTFLERAEPRVGNTVKTSPTEVRLWFSDHLDPAYSDVQVVNEAGEQVDKGDGQVDSSNPVLLRVSLPSLPSGAYQVIWSVLSVDGHAVREDFTFRVTP